MVRKDIASLRKWNLNFILGQQPMASIGIIIAETRGFQIWLASSCCVKWGEFQYQLVHPLHIKVG